MSPCLRMVWCLSLVGACCGSMPSQAANQWVVSDGPALMPPANLGAVSAVAVGQGYAGWAIGLRTSGTVVAWGDLGAGPGSVPAGLAGVRQVAAGSWHVLALLSNGTVRAWGVNAMNQTSVPAGLTGIVEVAAGSQHSLALKSNGRLVAWGHNLYGQCNVPAGLSNVIQIAAAGDQSMALRANGTVVAWGTHGFTAGQNLAPPGGIGPVVDIAAAAGYSVALRADGQAVTWSATDTNLYYAPPSLSNAVKVYGGALPAALLADGGVVRWQNSGSADDLGLPGDARAFSASGSGWLAVLAAPVHRRTRAAVPQDYDGDGRTDLAAFHPGSATWHIQRSSNGQPLGGGPVVWGSMSSFAVPADYDGDGRADLATYDRNTGTWQIRRSTDLTMQGGGPIHHGGPSFVPVPQDYDGDGRADIALMHFGSGDWYIWQSSDGTLMGGGPIPFPAAAGGTPVLGDFDGDGLADPAVTQASGFRCLLSRTGEEQVRAMLTTWSGTAPVSADFNGDGVTDQADWRWKTVLGELGTVLRAGAWTCQFSRYLPTSSLGNACTLPAVGDYDGDGTSDQAVFSTYACRWQIYASSTRQVTGGYAGIRWPASRVSGLVPADPQYQINRIVGAQP